MQTKDVGESEEGVGFFSEDICLAFIAEKTKVRG